MNQSSVPVAEGLGWTELGVIVALFSAAAAMLWNLLNWIRTSRLDQAVRFEAVHGVVLDSVLQTLTDASDAARRLRDDVKVMSAAAAAISSSLRPLITLADHRFKTEIGTIQDSALSRDNALWAAVATDANWEEVWSSYKTARQAETFSDMNRALEQASRSIDTLKREITKARISENELGLWKVVRRMFRSRRKTRS